MRYLVLVFALIIVVANVYFFLEPFSQNNIEDHINEYLDTIIISSELYNQDLKELGLLPYSSIIGNQIREKMTQEATLTIVEIENNRCIIEVTNYEYGKLFIDTLENYIIDDSLSFEENRSAMMEKIINRMETDNLNQKSWLVELELIENGGNHEPVLNHKFYNALYGGLFENMDKFFVEMLSEGDLYE